jgi:hypothetical protein
MESPSATEQVLRPNTKTKRNTTTYAYQCQIHKTFCFCVIAISIIYALCRFRACYAGFLLYGGFGVLYSQPQANRRVETEQRRLRMESLGATEQLLHPNTSLQEAEAAVQIC